MQIITSDVWGSKFYCEKDYNSIFVSSEDKIPALKFPSPLLLKAIYASKKKLIRLQYQEMGNVTHASL